MREWSLRAAAVLEGVPGSSSWALKGEKDGSQYLHYPLPMGNSPENHMTTIKVHRKKLACGRPTSSPKVAPSTPPPLPPPPRPVMYSSRASPLTALSLLPHL